MSKSTITDLPNDIRQAVPHYKENNLLMQLIREAEAGQFHCFKSTKYTMPKTALWQLIHQTKESALLPISGAVINGEYDESPDAEDKAEIKKIIATALQ